MSLGKLRRCSRRACLWARDSAGAGRVHSSKVLALDEAAPHVGAMFGGSASVGLA